MFAKIIIGFFTVFSLLGFQPQRTTVDDLQIVKPKTAEQHIQEIFGTKAKIATAVLTHESGLKLDAKGYNCMYNGKSKACKKEDRPKAWSVDCGISQVNVKGKICPPELLTLEGNMEAVEKIYKEQGLNAWVSYKNGKYKKHL